ncbi:MULTISPECIES: DUF7344 domain-containing protein [Halomicrobium]|uniref:DUF7344 domain-containing protein n=2 Tax=Halomicrobium mukohataei TaxID=57705 RepID=C7NVP6_HALMD|nr:MULTISPECIES: hypothetical protein [Halomicrobium]ACV46161.1 conserved hypothetical protein [Halomicrobium mukohataei DSM 12286]QCD64730.1 hypothetical protein E5139_03375 [Halomicrobium mukohataei]QFR19537.1 hypothetical protein GBQ70_03375 [Halomicrobium sp. ZPS1]
MTNQPTGEPDGDEWRGMTPRDRGLTVPMIDDVFELLADWRRRAVVLHFVDTEASSATVEALATAVTQRGMGRDCLDVVSVSAVRTDLVEVHLPRLDEKGVLDFDRRSESVHYWGQPTVEKWAEHVDEVLR